MYLLLQRKIDILQLQDRHLAVDYNFLDLAISTVLPKTEIFARIRALKVEDRWMSLCILEHNIADDMPIHCKSKNCFAKKIRFPWFELNHCA